MAALSDTALVHHHDEALISTARALSTDLQEAERQAAAAELRHAFCAHLKSARERRGISLRTIAESTKVSESLFADLERCDLSRWPTGLYRRAFFREYAAFVGLPGESMVSEFVRLFPEDLEQVTSELRVPGPLRLTLARPFWRHLSPMHAVAAGIDLLAVLIGAIAIAELARVNLWGTLGAVAVTYHTLGTAIRGCSLGTWWLRLRKRRLRAKGSYALLLALAIAAPASAQQSTFKPEVGQAGKDVVWVPTPEVMVERMLDLAKVTPNDYVIDLGSGDGRNVIGAAKRGANALGVEYNPDMVALSKRRAAEAGVPDKAQFVEGDMYVADISQASVLAIFLLPQNMLKLRDKFLAMKPGSRIVSNTFSIEDWEPDYIEAMPNCSQWCTALLWIVPAPIAGSWQTPQGTLTITQQYQRFSGSAGTTPVRDGKINGEQVTFALGGSTITARASGNRLEGTAVTSGTSMPWTATRSAR